MILVLLTTLANAHAEEAVEAQNGPIYESVDGVPIGRVFMSPGERERLDAIRHLPQQATAATAGDAAPSAEPEAPARKGMGFIQVSGKPPRVFRDGDFVRAPVAPGVSTLPAGIIVRHESEGAEQEGSPEP